MKRIPRIKRPRTKRVKGYDSIWEYVLHDTLLKNWEHHTDKVEYSITHSYEPDFTRTLQDKLILLESKGRFWDYAEYSKYIWVRKNLPANTELVFLFANPSAPELKSERTEPKEPTVNGQPQTNLDGSQKRHCLMSG